jgi:hypothetical protein
MEVGHDQVTRIRLTEENPMLRKTTIGLAATAALTLAATAPAFAMVPKCVEQPNADSCPTFGLPTPPNSAPKNIAPKNIKHTHYLGAESPKKG